MKYYNQLKSYQNIKKLIKGVYYKDDDTEIYDNK